MYRNYHKIFSEHLRKDIEFDVFGKEGKPVVVFPCSEATFYQYKDAGMIDAIHDYIESGDIRVFSVSSVDGESWHKPVKDKWMGIRHRQYELAVIEEILPFIAKEYHINERFMATGASWGAYHSLNFFLKFPWIFDSAVCQSGAYSLRTIIGNYYDENVYYNDILMYLPGLNDGRYLNELRDNYLIISYGQGRWERWNEEADAVVRSLIEKDIPHWHSVWGPEYPHDWHAWRTQIQHFLYHLKSGVLFKDGKLKVIGPSRRRKNLKL